MGLALHVGGRKVTENLVVDRVGLVTVLVSGVLLSLPQWLVIKRHVKGAARWAAASTLGLLLGFIVANPFGPFGFLVFGSRLDINSSELVSGALVGGIVGFGQWLVLRGQVPASLLWIPASAIGGLPLGETMSYLVFACFGIKDSVACHLPLAYYPLVEAEAGAKYGALTGLVLVWLLRRKLLSHSTTTAPSAPESQMALKNRLLSSGWARAAIWLSAGIIALCLWAYRESVGTQARVSLSQAEAARSTLGVGLSLGEAERRLSTADGFWRHTACGYLRDSALHYFFFGSQHRALTGIVSLRTSGPVDQQVIRDTNVIQTHLLGAYDECPDA